MPSPAQKTPVKPPPPAAKAASNTSSSTVAKEDHCFVSKFLRFNTVDAAQQKKKNLAEKDEEKLDTDTADSINKNICRETTLYQLEKDRKYCILHLPKGESSLAQAAKLVLNNPPVLKKIKAFKKLNCLESNEKDFDFQLFILDEFTAALTKHLNRRSNTERKDLRYVCFPENFGTELFFQSPFRQINLSHDFRGAIFYGEVDFTKVEFLRPVNFTYAIFRDDAIFKGCVFRANVDFTEARFYKDANFRKSKFIFEPHRTPPKLGVDFESILSPYFPNFRTEHVDRQSYAVIDFSKVDFGGKANFSEVECKAKKISFADANFRQIANFKRTLFERLEKHADGERIIVSFEDVDFFDAARFTGNDPTGSSWDQAYVTFEAAYFKEPSKVGFGWVKLNPSGFFRTDPKKIELTSVKWENLEPWYSVDNLARLFNDRLRPLNSNIQEELKNYNDWGRIFKNYSYFGFWKYKYYKWLHKRRARNRALTVFRTSDKTPEIDAERKTPEVNPELKTPEVEAEPKTPKVDVELETPEVDAEPKTPEVEAEVKTPQVNAELKTPEVEAELKAREVEKLKVREVEEELKARAKEDGIKTREKEDALRLQVNRFCYDQLSQTSRRLAISCEEDNLHVNSSHFRYMAMESGLMSTASGSNLLSLIYKLFSGYGEKTFKTAIILALFFLILPTVFYSTKGQFRTIGIAKSDSASAALPSTSPSSSASPSEAGINPAGYEPEASKTANSVGENHPDWKESLRYSIQMISLQKPELQPVDNPSKYISLIQGLLGPLQLALLALAIRRRFIR